MEFIDHLANDLKLLVVFESKVCPIGSDDVEQNTDDLYDPIEVTWSRSTTEFLVQIF